MKQKLETCPGCGRPMTPTHRLVLLIPKIVWDEITKRFVRKWSHGTADPNLN